MCSYVSMFCGACRGSRVAVEFDFLNLNEWVPALLWFGRPCEFKEVSICMENVWKIVSMVCRMIS